MIVSASVSPKVSPTNPIQGRLDWLFSQAANLLSDEGLTLTERAEQGGFLDELRVECATIMFADVVESVRLVEKDERANVIRIRHLITLLTEEAVTRYRGVILERRGDGVLVRFESAAAASACAATMHDVAANESLKHLASEPVALRIGIVSDEILVNDEAVYGRAINIAARLAATASPGQTIVSEKVRDQLTAGVDAAVLDLGECFLKHVERPVRLYALERADSSKLTGLAPDEAELRPHVAVLPLQTAASHPEAISAAFTVSDELNHSLARIPELFVVSRLSMQALTGRALSPIEVRATVNADYVVSGQVSLLGDRFKALIELCDARSNEVVWSDRLTDSVSALLLGDCDAIAAMCAAISNAVLGKEVARTQSQPLPTLASQSLLAGAIALMHRSSPDSHDRSGRLLTALIDRHSRHATPYMWYAKQRLLRSWRGWAKDAQLDAQMARNLAEKALQNNPESDLAYAIRGMVSSHIDRDFEHAGRCYETALQLNPNEPLTWIFLSTKHSFLGDGAAALAAACRSLELSPLDPLRYYYESLTASAALTAGDWTRAIELASASRRANRYHLSNYRVLAIAHGMRGEVHAGHAIVDELLALDPDFSISRFVARSAGARSDLVQDFAAALRFVGVRD